MVAAVSKEGSPQATFLLWAVAQPWKALGRVRLFPAQSARAVTRTVVLPVSLLLISPAQGLLFCQFFQRINF